VVNEKLEAKDVDVNLKITEKEQEILTLFDHRLILRKDTRFKDLKAINKRIRLVDYQPTCENMLIEIVEILKQQEPKGTKLIKGFLRETANSYAEWHAEDNKTQVKNE